MRMRINIIARHATQAARPGQSVGGPRWRSIGVGVLFLGFAAACGVVTSTRIAPATSPSTYDRILEEAEQGDPDRKNVVGYLLSTGLSPAGGPKEAFTWFQTASREGHSVAGLNLAIMYYLGAGVEEDLGRARRLFDDVAGDPVWATRLQLTTVEELVVQSCEASAPEADVGRDAYLTFCAGCHGSVGIAEFVLAPSFALGERMEKSLGELLNTVLHGHVNMPRWDDKLPEAWLEQALVYARSLEDQFRWGLIRRPVTLPEYYFRFGPMSDDFAPAANGLPVSSEDTFEDYCVAFDSRRTREE